MDIVQRLREACDSRFVDLNHECHLIREAANEIESLRMGDTGCRFDVWVSNDYCYVRCTTHDWVYDLPDTSGDLEVINGLARQHSHLIRHPICSR